MSGQGTLLCIGGTGVCVQSGVLGLMANRPTIAELRATYSPEKRQSDRSFSLWVAFVARPISFYITWVFIRADVRATPVTWFGAGIALAGCVFLALGGYLFQVAGALLIALWSVLDTVYGNLARYYGSAGKRGEFMDALVGYLVVAALFCSLGIGAFVSPDRGVEWAAGSLGLGDRAAREVFLYLGVWSALMVQLAIPISSRYRSLFGESFRQRLPRRNLLGRAFSLALLLRSATGYGAMAPFVLAGAIAGIESAVILYYAAFGTAGMLLVATTTALRAPRD